MCDSCRLSLQCVATRRAGASRFLTRPVTCGSGNRRRASGPEARANRGVRARIAIGRPPVWHRHMVLDALPGFPAGPRVCPGPHPLVARPRPRRRITSRRPLRPPRVCREPFVEWFAVFADRYEATCWMRIRLPAGSRNAQSRRPYGWSVGSWTTSASPACSRSKTPSTSGVARLMLE